MQFWSECDGVQDYIIIYDGYTTRDPVLLKFCGGGTPLPDVISSGPEILVEFSTSQFGTMLNPTQLLPLHGFQLEVQVIMRSHFHIEWIDNLPIPKYLNLLPTDV